tara:strand:+ start:857 stop:1150 length:294 start_codon:yes stop_codon:yes gene_type:complete
MDYGSLDPDNPEAIRAITKEFNLTAAELVEALEFTMAIHQNADMDNLSKEQRFLACIAAIGAIMQDETSMEAQHARVLQVVQLLDGAMLHTPGITLQ